MHTKKFLKKIFAFIIDFGNYLICKNKNLKRMYKNDKMVVRNR